MTSTKKTTAAPKRATVSCRLKVGADLADDLPDPGRHEAGDTVDLPAGHWLIEQGYATPVEGD